MTKPDPARIAREARELRERLKAHPTETVAAAGRALGFAPARTLYVARLYGIRAGAEARPAERTRSPEQIARQARRAALAARVRKRIENEGMTVAAAGRAEGLSTSRTRALAQDFGITTPRAVILAARRAAGRAAAAKAASKKGADT